MNPFFITALFRMLSLKRTCPECKRGQTVSSDKKGEPVKCKFCGATIPPRATR